jgi:ABC-type uncharacterized transport system, periplasmic component
MTNWLKKSKMQIIAGAMAVVGLLSGCATGNNTGKEEQDVEYQIGVVQFIEHESLTAARLGFEERMNELGIRCTLDIQNAQGDQSTLKTISQRFVNNNVDLVLAIATPAVQSISNETSTIPILGTAVTDYEAAKLIASNEKPGGNVTGTSDLSPIKEQLELIPILKADAKKVGLLYTSSEENSNVQIQDAKAVLDEMGMAYQDYPVTAIGDIQQTMQAMVEDVDVIYIPTDNLVASAMPVVSDVAVANQVPVIAGAAKMVLDGGTATYGLNYHSLGRQTADMAQKILKEGKKPADMPVERLEKFDFIYNENNVEKLGIEIPQELVHDAITE